MFKFNLYNLLLEKVIIPIGDSIFGLSTKKHLDYFREVQYLNKVDVLKIQNDKLHSLLSFALNKVPFYESKNITLTSNPINDLLKFPIIKKKDIKDNNSAFLSRSENELIKVSSSGSSGVQVSVFVDKNEISIARAIQTLWWEWAGYKIGEQILQTGISPNRTFTKKLKDFFFRTIYVPAFGLSEQEILNVLSNIRNKKDINFGGYASSLFVFACIAEKNNINGIKFKSAFSWGDKLFPHYRAKIKEVFDVNVFDTYGCSEGIMIAAQCEHGKYHITDPHVVVEIVNSEGERVPDGELGYVLVTRLDGYSMPLIRYYLGDLAVKSADDTPCACGRGYSCLEKIVGRDTDLVMTPGGKYMVVHTFTGIFEYCPEIKQFMVVQNNFEGIDIHFIKDENFSQDVLEKVKNKLYNLVGEVFPVNFIEVDFIPPTPSGKPQIVKSNVKINL